MAIISGVRPTLIGSSAGSPGGTDPSGSSVAARCPWLRVALTTDIATPTQAISSSSLAPVASGGAAAGAGAAGAATGAAWPSPSEPRTDS